MSSATDHVIHLTFNARPPLDCLRARTLNARFSLPSPLLRGLGRDETPDGSLWSDWLANWGWAWSVSPEACRPTDAMLDLWAASGNFPDGFDARALSLAAALQMKIDGQPLGKARAANGLDLQRVWDQIARLDEDALAQMLALALLRANADVFDFASVCPQWPADVALVIAERLPIGRVRAPAPPWLSLGYALLGRTFEDLRTLCTSEADCLDVYNEFANGQPVPLAFAMAYWWEAAYCLTERHAYADAERAQARVAELAKRLEALSGLVDPLWHHQQGRLYYYAGNHADALAEFLRELKAHENDLPVRAMLERDMANVLSDLGCLEAAARFALDAIEHARMQAQISEQYKSLGRLAEIRLKQGRIDEAETLFAQSFELQSKITDHRASAQTLTYRGHVAVLKGELETADARYDEAARCDTENASAAYLTMGRFAIAARRSNAVALSELWQTYRVPLCQWRDHPTQVLPATACVLAACRSVPEAQSMLPSFTRALLDARYAIEALPTIAALPVEQQYPLLQDVRDLLMRWQSALAALPAALKNKAGPLNGPARLAESLGSRPPVKLDAALLSLCYPMNLVYIDQ